MRKRSLLLGIIIMVITFIFYINWLEQNKSLNIINILESSQFIDSIVVKDGKTSDEVIELTKFDNSFTDIVEIYRSPYKDLSRLEKKILNEKEFLKIEYLQNRKIKYTVNIYQINQEQFSNYFKEDISTYDRYIYKLNNKNYIFILEENSQLLNINEGFKELLNIIFQKNNT